MREKDTAEARARIFGVAAPKEPVKPKGPPKSRFTTMMEKAAEDDLQGSGQGSEPMEQDSEAGHADQGAGSSDQVAPTPDEAWPLKANQKYENYARLVVQYVILGLNGAH